MRLCHGSAPGPRKIDARDLMRARRVRPDARLVHNHRQRQRTGRDSASGIGAHFTMELGRQVVADHRGK
eukprot:scaffold70726_cov62-Phaeocystis_antarctica.AAC.5